MVRFLLDGETIAIDASDPQATVLDLIRYRLRRTGTKEGCAEGDCGACTVLLGELDGDAIRWRAVNSCILFTPMLDGKALMTVESVGTPADLHPIQRALVDCHGSQCGFCTPGFVMSLYARSVGALGTGDTPVADVIAGNLCRCTGYGPILQAADAATEVDRKDDPALIAALKALGRTAEGPNWFAPADTDELAALLIDHPDARIVAGATDVGLWVTKHHRALGTMIFIGDVADMKQIAEDEHGLTLGAGVRYSEARAALGRLHPDLGELLRRIGGVQIRNAGTIGGNIANGSPIGDMPPALIALGATLTLRRGGDRRDLPIEHFFREYGVQDRRPGEFVETIHIPRPAHALVRITKVSKRFDSDISALCAAFMLTIVDDVVIGARIAFGGMAGIPARAPAAEAAMIGRTWCAATIEAAAQALARDYAPLDDLRASASYRRDVAANLLRRLWWEQAGEPVSVLDARHG